MNEIFQILINKPDVANAVIALSAFVVSIASLYVSHATLKHQRHHNVLSVKPLIAVAIGDYEDRLTVKVRNNGSGPLIVKAIQVRNGDSVKETVIDWMPTLPHGMYWSTFAGRIDNRSVLPGGEIILLELVGDPIDAEFAEFRNSVRAALGNLTVVADFTDVYGTKTKPYTKNLSWFTRNLRNLPDNARIIEQAENQIVTQTLDTLIPSKSQFRTR